MDLDPYFDGVLDFDQLLSTMGIPKKKKTEVKKELPIGVFDEETQQLYQIIDHIGETYGTIKIPVYNVENEGEEELFFSLKLINATLGEPLNRFTQEIEANDKVPHQENVMGIAKRFVSDPYFCVVFPSMSMGSIRSIMVSHYPDGLPEDFIVIALKETLKGLSHIHDQGQFHKEINAGHIYMDSKGEIKIGFAATVYEELSVLNRPKSSTYMPMISVCNWGVAPEVYDSGNAAVYSAKSDIWLIGLTALELAFGDRLRLHGRYSMDIIAARTSVNQTLPLHGEQGSKSAERTFSKEFQKMVAKCLAKNPVSRPTAAELLESKVFKNSKELLYFRNFLVGEM